METHLYYIYSYSRLSLSVCGSKPYSLDGIKKKHKTKPKNTKYNFGTETNNLFKYCWKFYFENLRTIIHMFRRARLWCVCEPMTFCKEQICSCLRFSMHQEWKRFSEQQTAIIYEFIYFIIMIVEWTVSVRLHDIMSSCLYIIWVIAGQLYSHSWFQSNHRSIDANQISS